MDKLTTVTATWFATYDGMTFDDSDSVSPEQMARIDAMLAQDDDPGCRVTELLWKGEEEVYGDSLGTMPVPALCDSTDQSGLCLRPF